MADKIMITLKSFQTDRDTFNTTEPLTVEYLIAHQRDGTTLEQRLTLTSGGLMGGEWSVSISLDDFPAQVSPQKAAHKLAEWLERLSVALLDGAFDHIDLNNVARNLRA